MKIAQEIYLALAFASEYPDQAPEHKSAKWYDLFWLLIPIAGIVIFNSSVETRYNLQRKEDGKSD